MQLIKRNSKSKKKFNVKKWRKSSENRKPLCLRTHLLLSHIDHQLLVERLLGEIVLLPKKGLALRPSLALLQKTLQLPELHLAILQEVVRGDDPLRALLLEVVATRTESMARSRLPFLPSSPKREDLLLNPSQLLVRQRLAVENGLVVEDNKGYVKMLSFVSNHFLGDALQREGFFQESRTIKVGLQARITKSSN